MVEQTVGTLKVSRDFQTRILAQAQASLTTVELSSHLARIQCRLQAEIILGDRHEKMSGNYFWFFKLVQIMWVNFKAIGVPLSNTKGFNGQC